MNRFFSKLLRDNISKRKRKSLSVFSKLPVKINSITYSISANFIGNGGGGGYFLNWLLFTITGPNGGGGGSGNVLYNKFIPNFKIKVKR